LAQYQGIGSAKFDVEKHLSPIGHSAVAMFGGGSEHSYDTKRELIIIVTVYLQNISVDLLLY
jgi:hypothetical protein